MVPTKPYGCLRSKIAQAVTVKAPDDGTTRPKRLRQTFGVLLVCCCCAVGGRYVGRSMEEMRKKKRRGGPGSNIICWSGKVQPIPFWEWRCVSWTAKRRHK